MAKLRKRRERRYRPSAPLLNIRLPRSRVEIDRGLAWYCLFTAVRAERRVEAALRDAGLATYTPVETVRALKRGRVVEDDRLAIGRYVFVGLHGAQPQWEAVHEALEQSFSWMLGVPALGRVLKSRDGTALRVPAGALQELADAITRHGEPVHGASAPFRSGDTARVVNGLWQGLQAEILDSSDLRVRGLLDLFGRKTVVEFDNSELEAA